MQVELVQSTTSDGLRLDGALQEPAEPRSRTPLDGAILLHGVASNFYSAALLEALAGRLLKLGIRVLRANTRGHDGLYTAYVQGQAKRQGAAYETVDECRQDIRAWCDFLAPSGEGHLLLLGHSLGAIKSVYAMAHEPPPAACAVIACSPPSLSYRAFMAADAPGFREAMTRAERLVEEGRGEELIEVPFPYPLVITAAGYVDKYGRAERYDILKFADRVRCPLLFTYGQLELESGSVAFAGLPERLGALDKQGGRLDVVNIPEANHNYSGKTEQLGEEIARWLEKTEL